MRASGSLRNSPSSSGVSGPARRGGAGASSTTARSVLSASPRRNGEIPSTATYSSAPSDHRSEGMPGRRPVARSGARYSAEPTRSPVRVRVPAPSIMAIPKSVSTTRPPASSSTFAGFTSRCSTPTACAARSARSTRPPMRAASLACSAPSCRSTASRDSPRTSSITIQGRPSCSTTSCTVMTFGWLIRAAARASCFRRAYRTRTSASSIPSGARTSLAATSRSSTSSTASQTTPMPPRPSCSRSR